MPIFSFVVKMASHYIFKSFAIAPRHNQYVKPLDIDEELFMSELTAVLEGAITGGWVMAFFIYKTCSFVLWVSKTLMMQQES